MAHDATELAVLRDDLADAEAILAKAKEEGWEQTLILRTQAMVRDLTAKIARLDPPTKPKPG